MPQLGGTEAGLLGKLGAGDLLGVGHVLAVQRALGQLPEPLPNGVAVLLHQRDRVVVVQRQDHRRRPLLHHRVQAGRAVGALQPVLAHAHPAVLVDHLGRGDPRRLHAIEREITMRWISLVPS